MSSTKAAERAMGSRAARLPMKLLKRLAACVMVWVISGSEVTRGVVGIGEGNGEGVRRITDGDGATGEGGAS